MQESKDVFVVFIEIIFSPGDVFDSNIKIFWLIQILTKDLTNEQIYAILPLYVIFKM